jgi:N-methylhydantoinase A
MVESRYVCAIDTGGTFTDCVVLDDRGRLTQAKSPSTPTELSRGVFDAMSAAASELGLGVGDLLAATSHLIVGSTLGTNALLQNRGAQIGMIVTRGHKDVVHMMRGHGRNAGRPVAEALAVHLTDKPDPIVPRSRIVEVDERIDCFGEVVVGLDRDQVAAATRSLVAAGVDAIAVCFLWSFLNDDHEHQARVIVQSAAPDLFVTTSSEVAPRWGEYERWMSAVINALLGDLTARFVEGIEERLSELGYAGQLLLMTCSGGCVPAAEAKRLPVLLLDSGPVGGITGTRYLAQILGHPNVIATDMGGTSFDVGLVRAGESVRSGDRTVGQLTFYVPNIDVRSIGSGGGSIAWVDENHNLHVGPNSVGADPGPACYGRGGTTPSVTDAHVVLGGISADFFLGGEVPLDVAASESALATIAGPLGMDTSTAAAGVLRITEALMADLLRRMTIEKGFDPADFVLYSYGGAGGLHAAAFARELGIKTVVVPLAEAASVWSAFGVAASDVLHVYEATELMIAPVDAPAVEANVKALEQRARQQLEDEGVASSDITLRRFVSIRYGLQVHELTVPFADGQLGDREMKAAIEAFELAYEDRYGAGSGYSEAGFEFVSVSVEAVGTINQPALATEDEGDEELAQTDRTRSKYWAELGAFVDTAIFRREDLRPGRVIEGPAIIELATTTVAVGPGDVCRQDPLGNLVMEVAPSGR